MSDLPFDAAPPRTAVRWLILLGWAAVAGFLIAHHVVWRDEVRALTMALRGDDVIAMLRGVRGEGHPALWYAMLRAGHALVPVPQVLPGVAALVGFAAAALFALRAPFRAGVIALVLFGGFFLIEYTVVARNYGIAMLILFALATLKPGRGVVEGLLLAALANTSVPAVIFVGAYLLFRSVEVATTRGAAWRPLMVAGALATLGVLACVATVYPPVNDAAVAPRPEHMTLAAWGGLIVRSLIAVAPALHSLLPESFVTLPGIAGVLTLLLIASPFSLLRTPGGTIAGVAALAGCALFYGLIYPGSYRHHALYLAFLIALHWLSANGRGGRWPDGWQVVRVARFGGWALVLLLTLQVPWTARAIVRAAQGKVYSHSADLAALLRRPDLRGAVVLGSPDYMLEPLHYYAENPTWFLREGRFGTTVRYTRDVRLALTLADVLTDARRLRAATGRPVVIVLRDAPDPEVPASTVPDGYVTTFSSDPAMVRAFLSATQTLATFADAETDENYAVYRLR